MKSCKKHGEDNFGYRNAMALEEICLSCLEEEKRDGQLKNDISSARRNLSLPKRLCGCGFDNYEVNIKNAPAKKRCFEFAENPDGSGGIIMLGGVGTGKTHLAVAICKTFCDRGDSVKIITVPEIIRNVRSTWSGNKKDINGQTETEGDVIKEYSSGYKLLVIDEIGIQYGSDSEKIIISEIINNRYNNMIPTIVVGNVDLTEAIEYLGQRAIDRIKDNGHIIIFDWESHRKLKK
jgi:DNA replication protein DnaC